MPDSPVRSAEQLRAEAITQLELSGNVEVGSTEDPAALARKGLAGQCFLLWAGPMPIHVELVQGPPFLDRYDM